MSQLNINYNPNNSNVPIVDVPKWLCRGGVRPNNWDNVLKSVFFNASLRQYIWGQIVYDKGQIVYIEAGCFKTGERGSIAPRKSTKSQEI